MNNIFVFFCIALTAGGYLYHLITMRSAYKMNRRVKKFKKRINKGENAIELRQIQENLENAGEKKLLPHGSLGDLLSLIESRAKDLGLGDFIPTDISVEPGVSEEGFKNDLTMTENEVEEGGSSNNEPPNVVATATLKGTGKGGGGVKRPSYHPKDHNRDGSVDVDDKEFWSQMSQRERDFKRHDSSRKKSNIASQVVGFSILPKSLKDQCHCGKKKVYLKCHFKKDACPCGNGKKFSQCCAESRGYSVS
jgi:hypothetical protein